MADNQTPWFVTKIECPVCGFENSFEIIKQGSYTESGRDTDFCPTGRSWKNQAYQNYNPILFFTGTCKNCNYTREITSSFKEWHKDNGFRTYRLPNQKKKHLAEIAKESNIFKILSGKIDYKNFPNESAILKLILAIYDELLLDRPTSLDLARFYLRIAWVYREISGGQSSDITPAQITLNKIQNELKKLQNAFEIFDDSFKSLASTISNEIRTVLPEGNRSEESAKGLLDSLGDINKNWSEIAGFFDSLKTNFDNAKSNMSDNVTENEDSDQFDDHASFPDFLKGARETWDGIPLSELDALRFALEFYKKAYLNGKEIKAGLQQLQASYMIGELSRRVGDEAQAMEYFKNSSKQAHEMMTRHRNDRAVFSNSQKLLEMSLEQARLLKKPETANK